MILMLMSKSSVLVLGSSEVGLETLVPMLESPMPGLGSIEVAPKTSVPAVLNASALRPGTTKVERGTLVLMLGSLAPELGFTSSAHKR